MSISSTRHLFALKEFPVYRSDLWLRDVCLVCQTRHSTTDDKSEHSTSSSHLKRMILYDFFSKESRSLKSSNRRSVLLERYKRSGTFAAGLECIHEFVMPFCSSPWWACSICYEADADLYTLDAHLHSILHIKTYVEEFHPGRVVDESVDRFTMLTRLYAMRAEVLEEQGKLESPEVLDVEGVSREWAMEKLAIAADSSSDRFKIGELFGGHEALHCKVCHSNIASAEETRERCWETHLASSYHQRVQLLASMIAQFESHPIDNPFDDRAQTSKWEQNALGVYLGPMAGLQHLIYFGTFPYCDLCYAVLDEDRVMEHFCCENHLIKLLSFHRPGAMYVAVYLPDDTRRTQMLSIFDTIDSADLGGRPRKIEAPCIPELIRANSNPNVLNAPTLMPQLLPLGSGGFCLWCPVCWRALNVSSEESERIAFWTDHCTRSKDHFETAVRRSLFSFEEENFVDAMTTLHLPTMKEEAVWKTIELDGRKVEVQQQSDVGLDFLVDDLHAEEVVCIACAAIFPRSDTSQVALHIRSMDHLMQYLHATDREMLNLVMSQKSSQAERDLLIDYLRRSVTSPGTIRVYDVDLAITIARWGSVPYRKIELSTIEANARPIYALLSEVIDRVADDKVENIAVPVKEALQLCSLRIHSVNEKSILLWCMGCERAFSVIEGAVVEGAWDGHLLGASHARRVAALSKNKLDPNGFINEKPKLTATLVDQVEAKKKVVWRWNESAKLFEYVYAVLGLSDMVERRSVNVGMTHIPDIYCRLCAEVLPHSQEWLDSHIRSLSHIINYVQRYHTEGIAQLEALQRDTSDDGGKLLRKHLGFMLKNESCKLNMIGEMRVYHPDGVQKQREAKALKVAAMEAEKDRHKEKVKKVADHRKKVSEEQKQRVDSRRPKEEVKTEDNRHSAVEERRSKQSREVMRRRYEREREEGMKRREVSRQEEEKKAREAEARRRQRILAMERQRKKEGELKKNREPAREEHIGRLRGEEETLAEAQRVGRERQRIMQIQMELEREQRIEEEMIRIRHEKAAIIENLSTIQNRHEHSVDRDRLTVTVPNIGAQRLMVTVPSALGTSSAASMNSRYQCSAWSPVMQAVPLKDVDTSVQRPPSVNVPQVDEHPSRLHSPTVGVQQLPHHIRPDRIKKLESHIKAFKQIETRDLLVDYLWKQGGEMIPEAELPEVFNSVAARRIGLLGLSSVYQVQCSDRPTFETMYCSACSVWTTFADMFNHLMTAEHRLGYLFRNYKMYHKSAMSQPNETIREQMLEQFARQIWKLEGSGEVRYRLTCPVNYETVMRLWPQHIRLLSNDWMDLPDREMNATPPPGIDVGNEKESNKRSEARRKEREGENLRKKQRNGNDKGREEERIELRERDASSSVKQRSSLGRRVGSSPIKQRSQRSTSRRRSRSHSRHHGRTRSPSSRMHRSRSNSGSTSRGRRRSPLRITRLLSTMENVQDESTWEDAAAAFLAKIGDKRGAERVRRRSPSSRSRSRSKSSARRRSRSIISSGKCRSRSGSRYARTGSRASERIRRHSSRERGTSFDKRVEQETAGGLLKVWEGLPEEVDRRSSKDLTKAAPSDDDVDRILAKRAKVDQERPRDPKEDMRKLLGLLVTMQQEVQQRGQLDDATISRLYEEVGVSGGDMTSSGALLQQLCQMLVGDGASSSGGGFYQQAQHQSNIDFERFGIAPVKEQTTEASFVYPGAPDPEVQEAPTIHAPYTGYGGIGESVLRESPQVATINPWMNGASGGRPPLSLLPGAHALSNYGLKSAAAFVEPVQVQPNSADIYAARRMKSATSINDASSRQSAPSSWVDDEMGQPLSRTQDETGALSRSAGFPVAQSVPEGAIRMMNEVVDDDVLTDNEFEYGEVKVSKKKMINYTKKLLEMRPDLTKWTGANNRANNLRAGSAIATSAIPNQGAQKTPMNSWKTSASQQSAVSSPIQQLRDSRPMASATNVQAASHQSGQLKTARDGQEGQQEDSTSGQRTLTRSERRAQLRAAFLATKTAALAETTKAAGLPFEPKDDPNFTGGDTLGKDTVMLFGRFEGGVSSVRDAGYSAQANPLIAEAARSFGAFASNLPNTSINRNMAVAIGTTATWEDLGSTVSALFNNAKKQTAQNPVNFQDRKASIGASSSDVDGPPPPPPAASSSARCDPMSTAAVTQYSGQPTKYAQPTTTRIYNPTVANYGLPNTAKPLYSAVASTGSVFTAGVKQPAYDNLEQPVYSSMQQSTVYPPSSATQPQASTYFSYFSSFPSYSQF
uniref:C2H2-type domain-containing protein n=3 Tax=Parascaris univalens TaxID=6257 RepID=A0A915ADN1_PARUN